MVYEHPWGILLSIDLYTCNPKSFTKRAIASYVTKLVELLDMRKYGKCTIVWFGTDKTVAGYTMTQLIETSLISGHFIDLTKNACIDIFSCKPFDIDKAAIFTKEHFDAAKFHYESINRGRKPLNS